MIYLYFIIFMAVVGIVLLYLRNRAASDYIKAQQHIIEYLDNIILDQERRFTAHLWRQIDTRIPHIIEGNLYSFVMRQPLPKETK